MLLSMYRSTFPLGRLIPVEFVDGLESLGVTTGPFAAGEQIMRSWSDMAWSRYTVRLVTPVACVRPVRPLVGCLVYQPLFDLVRTNPVQDRAKVLGRNTSVRVIQG